MNDETPLPHFLHLLDHTNILSLDIIGDVSISFAGIVSAGSSLLLLKKLILIS